MQQLPSTGAVIPDEIQLPIAETAAAAKSTRSPSASHANMVCVRYEWGLWVFGCLESLGLLWMYGGLGNK